MNRRLNYIAVLVAMLFVLGTGVVLGTAQPKVILCHATSSETNPFVTLEVGWPAAYGQAGHFYENGTPRAGHEQDYLGACAVPSSPPSAPPSSPPSAPPSSPPSAPPSNPPSAPPSTPPSAPPSNPPPSDPPPCTTCDCLGNCPTPPPTPPPSEPPPSDPPEVGPTPTPRVTPPPTYTEG